MSQYVALGIAILALIVACYGVLAPRYEISAPDSHHIYRVNTSTGQVTYFELGYYSKKLEEKDHTAE